jgi:hypothetical protein
MLGTFCGAYIIINARPQLMLLVRRDSGLKRKYKITANFSLNELFNSYI